MAKELLEQTESKLAGQRSIPNRMVLFFDSQPRAIVKGKLDKPVEFCRTLESVQDDSGVIVHYELYYGNPSDKVHLLSVVRQKDSEKTSRANCRGSRILQCTELGSTPQGVYQVGIPKIGRLTPSETSPSTHKMVSKLRGSRPPSSVCLNANSA